MGKFEDDEIYPNQPLSDVACEVRFAGEMQVECERYRFWDQIRAAYPNIFVPHAKDGEAPALQHYRFKSEDHVRTIAVALNSIAYSESKYSGHKSFISEFDRLLGIFHATYPRLGAIKRVGWRYINVISFAREDGRVPLARFLNLEIPLPSRIFECTTVIDLAWTGKCMDGEMQIRVSSVARKEAPQQEGLILDIDFGQNPAGMEWSDLRSVIENSRSKCRGIFEELITDTYREYLRGVTV